MPLVRFAPGGSHCDVTPLENLFIEDFLPEAPGDFLKVYLYALMLCYRASDEQPQGFDDLCRALKMNGEMVRAAFAYWEALGLVKVTSADPFEAEFMNLKQKFLGAVAPRETERDRAFKELAEHVQSIFSGQRVVSPSEFHRVYDWYDTLHLEPAAIALLIRFCVGRKGPKVGFAYMDAVAQDLAARGIHTDEEMEGYILDQEALHSGAGRVLARWSQRRAPTQDEMALYRRWTGEWGFTEDAVMTACTRLTSASQPNFKYLNNVLEGFHDKGIHTARQMQEEMDREQQMREICADLSRALGARNSASNATELVNLYEHFSSLGFSESSILMAARMLCLEGRHTLVDLAARLNKWYEEGTVTDEAMAARRERNAEAEGAVRGWLKTWGQGRAPTAGETAAYLRFAHEWNLSVDLIDYAAERSALAERPLALMGTLLTAWREQGITTREGAEAAEARRPNRAGAAAPDAPMHRNEFTPEALSALSSSMIDLGDR